LFIEGDNLDALKLLQETYLNKVKLIYIDPPYNTGKDFIYRDNFAENTESFLKRSNQKDEVGHRLVSNTESNGRFHSDWLSMISSRLKLARNILADDGYIVASIDDTEVSNLMRVMHEIFGEENFLATLVWDRNRKNDAKFFSVGHEYMLVYAKNIGVLRNAKTVLRASKQGIEEVQELFDDLRYKHNDEWKAVLKGLKELYASWEADDLRKPLSRYKKVDENGPYRDDGNINWPGGGGPDYEVKHPLTNKPCKQPISGWRYPTLERFNEEVEGGHVVFGLDESTVPRVRMNLFESDDQVMHSVNFSYAQTAANEFNSIFDGKRVFDNPKNYKDLASLVSYLVAPDGVVLDFFAGSCSTAHAVMKSNHDEGNARKFIMIQLPEGCDNQSVAAKEGFNTIPEIGKERIRRAGKKILEGDYSENWNKDIGFRVLKIDTSNMKDVYYTPDEVTQEGLFGQIDNIKEDRTEEDLLFQVLLDWGVDLALPIKSESIDGKRVYFVDTDALAGCFETDIDEEFVKQMAERKPLRVVFRDSSYGSDNTKINVEQIFKLISPTTEVKTI
jgi:adenine-specific DNA-methyltransferase